MGQYTVILSDRAKEDLKNLYYSGQQASIKKFELLVVELSEHPYTGLGHPEQLRYRPGVWSRRLNQKDRLCYSVDNDVVTVYVLSARGHYDDK